MQRVAVLYVVGAEWLVGLEHFALIDEPLTSDRNALCISDALLEVGDRDASRHTKSELLLVVLQRLDKQSDNNERTMNNNEMLEQGAMSGCRGI